MDRSDLAHPRHTRDDVVVYVLGSTRLIPPRVAVDILQMVDKSLWKRLSGALQQWHYWDGSDLLFILEAPGKGVEKRPYPGVRTMVCLNTNQERRLRSIMNELEGA